MTIDYSADDLEQLLHVSSGNEYMSSLFGLHESFKSVVEQFENFDGGADKHIVQLLEEVKLGIAENQLAIQSRLNMPAGAITANSTIPPLFNELDRLHYRDQFPKNFGQYTLAVDLLSNSCDRLEPRDDAISKLGARLREDCGAWLAKLAVHAQQAPSVQKAAPVQEEPVQEEPVQEEPVQEEPAQEEPAQEEPAQEEPAQEDEPDRELLPKGDDQYEEIARVSDSVSNDLAQFLDNYDKLYNEKQSVTECVEQLTHFASKGLQVGSALEPLKKQFDGIEGTQAKYLARLQGISREFSVVIQEMSAAIGASQ